MIPATLVSDFNSEFDLDNILLDTIPLPHSTFIFTELTCQFSTSQYRWILSDNSTSEELLTSSDLRVLELLPLTFPTGFQKLCLEVFPEEPLDFYPQTECRCFSIKAPDLVAELKDKEMYSSRIDEILFLDASRSYVATSASGICLDLCPRYQSTNSIQLFAQSFRK